MVKLPALFRIGRKGAAPFHARWDGPLRTAGAKSLTLIVLISYNSPPFGGLLFLMLIDEARVLSHFAL